eukprot:gene9169-14744_t
MRNKLDNVKKLHVHNAAWRRFGIWCFFITFVCLAALVPYIILPMATTMSTAENA